MLRSLIASLAVLLSLSAVAAPLHQDDPQYRGAFTILGAGRLNGATAKYWTQIFIDNASDHTVYLRFELYPTTGGYREWTEKSNGIPVGVEGGYQWGWVRVSPDGTLGNDTLTNFLGEGMGALRIVAVRADGTDDPSAVIHGYARLWIEPYSGGLMSEAQTGLSDYDMAGTARAAGMFGGDPHFVIFRPIHFPDSRMAVVVTNFDRKITLHAKAPGQCISGTADDACTEGVSFEVPPGQSKRIPLEEISQAWFQTATVNVEESVPWASYLTFTDNRTNDSLIVYDIVTETLSMRH